MTKEPKGYNRIWNTKFGPRKYKRKSSIQHFRRTGSFKNVGTGSGHAAGEKWGEQKQINPNSRIIKYSKNSPSFDEGVYRYKKARQQALENKQK